jgi:exodeoxyribonuclease-3
MKIVTYNVNGIRSAMEKGFVDWMTDNDFDIVCVQEVKAHPGSVPVLLLEAAGYRHHWHPAQRKGYSGVAAFSKVEPSKTYAGLGIEKFDLEGRVQRVDFGELTILNCYFPNGGSGAERQAYKMEFLDHFHHWVEQLLEERPNIIVVGDYNIAHQKIDINDPVRNKSKSGFLPEERQWLTRFLASGFVDTFRNRYPDDVSYTWWRTTQFARESNKGWRLDYQCVSDALLHRVKSVSHLHDAYHSDHCPVLLELDWN